MLHLGNVPASSVLYIPFATYDKDDGSSITLTGLAVTDVEIYKNGSTTQRSSDAGYTLIDTDGIDFDAITGIHGFSVDLADNTDAGFYAVGSFYWVVVSAITVDGVTVNFIAATFRIVAAEAIAGKLKVDVDAWLGTAAATPTVNGVPEVDITHIGGGSAAADNLRRSAESIYYGSVTGAATTTTLIDSALTQADVDHWKGRIVIFLTGTLAKQATDITAFDPTTDKLTFTALSSAPSGADTYVIV